MTKHVDHIRKKYDGDQDQKEESRKKTNEEQRITNKGRDNV